MYGLLKGNYKIAFTQNLFEEMTSNLVRIYPDKDIYYSKVWGSLFKSAVGGSAQNNENYGNRQRQTIYDDKPISDTSRMCQGLQQITNWIYRKPCSFHDNYKYSLLQSRCTWSKYFDVSEVHPWIIEQIKTTPAF